MTPIYVTDAFIQIVRCSQQRKCSAMCVDIAVIRKQTAPVSLNEIVLTSAYAATHERPLATGSLGRSIGTPRFVVETGTRRSARRYRLSTTAADAHVR